MDLGIQARFDNARRNAHTHGQLGDLTEEVKNGTALLQGLVSTLRFNRYRDMIFMIYIRRSPLLKRQRGKRFSPVVVSSLISLC